MISTYERWDIIHIMKMNRLTLIDSDTAHLRFDGQVKEEDYDIKILVVDSPAVIIKQDGQVVFDDTVKSINKLKIFLDEGLYKYLEV